MQLPETLRAIAVAGRIVSLLMVAIPLVCTGPAPVAHAARSAGAATSQGCVTASCHAGMGKARHVHGPVAAGDCLVCHQAVGKHSFRKVANADQLCFDCHDRIESRHVARAGGKGCLSCHDPHQSTEPYQLRQGQRRH